MRINAIRKDGADVTLDADDLVLLHNLIHAYEKARPEEDLGRTFHVLAKHVEAIKTICQYGPLSGTAIKHIVRHEITAYPDGDVQEVLGRLISGKEDAGHA